MSMRVSMIVCISVVLVDKSPHLVIFIVCLVSQTFTLVIV